MPNLLSAAWAAARAVRPRAWVTVAATAAGSTFTGIAMFGFPAEGLLLAKLILGVYAVLAVSSLTVAAVIVLRGLFAGDDAVKLLGAFGRFLDKLR